MKTTFNIIVITLSALFIIPKAITTPPLNSYNNKGVNSIYIEPRIINKKKMDIDIIKADIRIKIKELELELNR